MKQYLDTVRTVLDEGESAPNRTGIDTLFKHGLYMVFNMDDGFPVVTTKKLQWKSAFAEMLGFVKGLSSAADFRDLGTKVWDANANANATWLNNPYRKGEDDMGRVYGVQWRDWRSGDPARSDQLMTVYEDLLRGVDNRREIVIAWNPGELGLVSLPPCHLMMQFGLRGTRPMKTLDLFVYIRSNDVGLGMPFNIAGYAWLLHVMARITGHQPGTLHYFAWNYHIYVNHIPALKEQLTRAPHPLPYLVISPDIHTLEDLEQVTDVGSAFRLIGYRPHPSIKMEMAV